MPFGVYSYVNCHFSKKEKFESLPHQKNALNYFLTSPYKGMLLYHELGSGKTCTSIKIADKMLKKDMIKHVYIFTPGSLRSGWVEEYCKKCGISSENLRAHYTFITTNYSVSKKIEAMSFDNSLVIIDEVHNLINGVKNFSKTPTAIYDKLLASNCRLLALSGTPIFNYVYEFALLGNLLKPGHFPEIRRNGVLDSQDFMKFFNIKEDGTVEPKNPTVIQRKLEGIISYYPGAGEEYVPTVIQHPPIRCVMSIQQENRYYEANEQEQLLAAIPPNKKLMATDRKRYELLKRLHIMALKRIMTRSVSNFYYAGADIKPEDAKIVEDEMMGLYEDSDSLGKEAKEFMRNSFAKDLIKKRLKDLSVKHGGWIEKSKFSEGQLKMYSPKISALLLNIVAHNRQKHVIFSFFKNKAGVFLIQNILKMCGIKSLIFSGDLDDVERKSVLKTFNSEKNKYGDVARVLLVTEAGAEGITVLTVRHVHILESSPRISKIIQMIGRAARFKSHHILPPEERNIAVWKYWSVTSNRNVKFTTQFFEPNGEIKKVSKTSNINDTVDEMLYKKGERALAEIKSFLDLLKKSNCT